ncbi:MAG: hypothetical protein IJX22_02280 [Opitutales bacterium]|nr:hypothetical protein [Opitutales bacterium]
MHPTMRSTLKIWFVSAVFGAFALPVFAETENPKTDSPDANALIAKRESETLIAELTELVVRRDAFYAEAETLPQNESSRRAADIAARYENLLTRFPDSVPALFFFAEFLHDGGENERAEKLLLKAEKLDETFTPAQFLLAEILAERGAAAEAFPRFRRGLSENPDAESVAVYGEFLCDHCDALLLKKVFPKRAELDREMQDAFILAAGLSDSDSDPNFYWRYAESFYDIEEPNWRAALSAWGIVARLASVKKNPELLAAVALHRARVLAELGRIDEANTLLRETVGVPALERSRRQVFEIIKRKREEGN